jgi:hypothetical protein
VQGFRDSQRLLEAMLAQYPGSTLYIRDLAGSTMRLGGCLLARGQRARATAELTRALALWDGLVAQAAQEPSYLQDRAWTLIVLGRWDEAVRAAQSLAALPDESGKNLLAAARILAFNLPRPGPDPLAAARVPPDRAAALAEAAMSSLARAITRGGSTREQLERDEDFAALRTRADFPGLFDLLLDRGFPADPFCP